MYEWLSWSRNKIIFSRLSNCLIFIVTFPCSTTHKQPLVYFCVFLFLCFSFEFVQGFSQKQDSFFLCNKKSLNKNESMINPNVNGKCTLLGNRIFRDIHRPPTDVLYTICCGHLTIFTWDEELNVKFRFGCQIAGCQGKENIDKRENRVAMRWVDTVPGQRHRRITLLISSQWRCDYQLISWM